MKAIGTLLCPSMYLNKIVNPTVLLLHHYKNLSPSNCHNFMLSLTELIKYWHTNQLLLPASAINF